MGSLASTGALTLGITEVTITQAQRRNCSPPLPYQPTCCSCGYFSFLPQLHTSWSTALLEEKTLPSLAEILAVFDSRFHRRRHMPGRCDDDSKPLVRSFAINHSSYLLCSKSLSNCKPCLDSRRNADSKLSNQYHSIRPHSRRRRRFRRYGLGQDGLQ